jgi:hypothetical protein
LSSIVASKGASKDVQSFVLDGIVVCIADVYSGDTYLRKGTCGPFGQFRNGKIVCWPMKSSDHVLCNAEDAQKLAQLGSLDVGAGIFQGFAKLNDTIGYGTSITIYDRTIRGIICVGFGKGNMYMKVVCNDGTCRHDKYLLTPDLQSNIKFPTDFGWVSKVDIMPL